MEQKSIIPIFFAIDENYASFLEVALHSMVKNASRDYVYEIYVLNAGLPEAAKESISAHGNEIFRINFYDVSAKLEEIKDKLHTRDYYSKTTYYRIFIPDLFPQYDKALYLDADIIVNADISELFNHDIGNNYLGAITEEAVNKVAEFIRYAKYFLGVPTPAYFNAGILIMNLHMLRKINLEKKFINLLNLFKFVVAQDQDYLNVLCFGHVYYIHKAWNKNPMPDSDVGAENVKIVHYTLTMKPWHYDGIQFGDMFWANAREVKLESKMEQIRKAFCPECVKKDQLAYESLKKLAHDLSADPDSFAMQVQRGIIRLPL